MTKFTKLEAMIMSDEYTHFLKNYHLVKTIKYTEKSLVFRYYFLSILQTVNSQPFFKRKMFILNNSN